MSSLEDKFKHRSWFIRSNLSNKQVIEFFASKMGEKGNNDFYFKELQVGIVVKGLEDGGTWKPNEEQLEYLKERIKFYEQYYKEHESKYDFENDWLNAHEQKCKDMINEIPEYKSFSMDFKNSLEKNRKQYELDNEKAIEEEELNEL